jgi:hypothetical protein
MKPRPIHFLLLGIWIATLLYAVGTVVSQRQEIPEVFNLVLTQIFDTLLPTLLMMLAFVYAEGKEADTVASDTPRVVVALVVTVSYVGLLAWAVRQFHADAWSAMDLVEFFQLVRTRAEAIIVIVLGYYFADRIRRGRRPAEPQPHADGATT